MEILHPVGDAMPAKLACAVIGEPRSGTSVTMLLLKELGVLLAGYKWPWEGKEFDPDIADRDRERIEKNFARIRELNPQGFWEQPGVVMHGIRELPEEFDGKALKIISSGAYPRYEDGRVFGTPPELYSRALLCLRNPRAIAKSQVQLERSVEQAGEDGWGTAQLVVAPVPYIQRTGGFLLWLSRQPDKVKDKFLSIDFDNLIEQPEPQIRRICQHLGIEYRKTDVIDPKLRRSVLPGWPEQVAEQGALADRLYRLASERKWGDIDTVWRADKEEWFEKFRREQARWIDTEWGTYRNINSTLWRGLRDNDKSVRDKLLKSVARHDYTKSEYYSEAPKTYTVERPADIGDITRPLIDCKHPKWPGLMTHERFKQLWTRWGRE